LARRLCRNHGSAANSNGNEECKPAPLYTRAIARRDVRSCKKRRAHILKSR